MSATRDRFFPVNTIDEASTQELLDELLSKPRVESYLDAHPGITPTLAEYLGQLLHSKGLVRAEVIAKAQIDATHGWQIFNGQRKAGRDKLFQLALAMGLNLLETTRLCQVGGVNALYPKTRRDAIIIFCIEHGASLMETNEQLFRFGEKTLGPQ